ncbi:CoA-binding protein [Desulforegula conservatrix]|uniref:CoA-binding protein n=1 Tax=Desulforegula conservatrix TaxID=153026 RepID=UPI0003FFCD01|nr:CoA-binding protein [Desulforegula conservatrix]
MKKGEIITSPDRIKKIIEDAKTVAIVGISPKQDRDSFIVARFLQNHGFRIIPVRPENIEILGERTIPNAAEITEQVDVLDIFRSSDQVMEHVEEAIKLKPRVFWMQLGVENMAAAEKLVAAGIDVIMNKCIKIEYAKYFG